MKFILFILFSLPVIWISWDSMKEPRKHGFFRFFAFEVVILLILHNAGRWFKNPFSPLQVLSWITLSASLILAIYGYSLLRQKGEPVGSFENTTRLVTASIYRYIRHPLYASVLYLGIGAFLKSITLTSIGLILAIGAFLYATARIEEEENIGHFGQAYIEYMKTTKMFIPWMF